MFDDDLFDEALFSDDDYDDDVRRDSYDDDDEPRHMSPTEFISEVNDSLACYYRDVLIEGEVASFKISQGKWVFFDLKDADSSVGCFMTMWSLHIPIEDGMRVLVRGTPKLTPWGKFSITVENVVPVGEGSLKKAFEKLKKKLSAEGLFDPQKKRRLPEDLTRLGVISSTGAAGYGDFIKILNARWGGIQIQVAHTQVQGMDAPRQIIRALNYFNERGDVQVIAILRGGGSADDLAAFNDEELVRAVAASKIPIISGIGHEQDETLIDFAADVRASTPSNAAELLVKDRRAEIQKVRKTMLRASKISARISDAAESIRDRLDRSARRIKSEVDRDLVESQKQISSISQRLRQEIMPRQRYIREKLSSISQRLLQEIVPKQRHIHEKLSGTLRHIRSELSSSERELTQKMRTIELLNPEKVLRQGYAILAGNISPGSVVKITTLENEINAQIKEVYARKKDNS